jgi:hypothetical protein
MDDDNDEADRKEDETAGEEEVRDYMQEDDARSSDSVGAEPDFSSKLNRQPTCNKSNNKIDHTVVHSSTMDDAMVQQNLQWKRSMLVTWRGWRMWRKCIMR